MDATSDATRMRLRYAGACRACGAALPHHSPAIFDEVAKEVVCLGCDADLRRVARAEAHSHSAGLGLAPAPGAAVGAEGDDALVIMSAVG